MPLKIIHPRHTEVMGTGLVLISSPPVIGQKGDLNAGQIAEEVALLARSWAIIAREIKQDQEGDKVLQAGSDFDKSVQTFVREYGIKCIIMIVGTSEPGILIKGYPDDSRSEEILEIVKSGLEPHFSTNSTTDNTGNGSARVTNIGAEDASGQTLPIVRLELGPDERGFMKDQFVNSITDIIGLINTGLGFSESKPRPGLGVSTGPDTAL
jgi:hypothetical protein